jgi:hypothetical protein
MHRHSPFVGPIYWPSVIRHPVLDPSLDPFPARLRPRQRTIFVWDSHEIPRMCPEKFEGIGTRLMKARAA